MAIFVRHIIVFFLMNDVLFSQLFQISIHLFLLLLYSLMMHFVEIPFFHEFVISSSGFFRHDYSFIEFIFDLFDIVLEVLADDILFGNWLTALDFFSLLVLFEPLLLNYLFFTWKLLNVYVMLCLIKKFLKNISICAVSEVGSDFFWSSGFKSQITDILFGGCNKLIQLLQIFFIDPDIVDFIQV